MAHLDSNPAPKTNMAPPLSSPDIPHNKITINNLRNKGTGMSSLASRATEQSLFSRVTSSIKATNKYNSQDTVSSVRNLALDRSAASRIIPHNKVLIINPHLGTTNASFRLPPVAFPLGFHISMTRTKTHFFFFFFIFN